MFSPNIDPGLKFLQDHDNPEMPLDLLKNAIDSAKAKKKLEKEVDNDEKETDIVQNPPINSTQNEKTRKE